MRLSLVLAGSAWIGLFIAGQAFGRPSADFCELNPESPLCGGIVEPPVDPASCEPEPADPEPTAFELSGSGRLKGPGFLLPIHPSFALSYDESTFTLDDGCDPWTGSVVAKGPSGKKFQLFLDEASIDGFADVIAERARSIAGVGGEALGNTQKLVLKENADGSLSLKVKIQVVVQDLGEVVYKASFTTIDPAATPETARVLCR